MNKYKLAILSSHPIQYKVPLFRELSRHPQLDVVVYFCCDHGVRKRYDPEFGKEFSWDIPLLDGYSYKFLKNWSPNPRPSFWGQINPEILVELRRNKFDAAIVDGWMSVTNWLVFLSRNPIFLKSENPLNQELIKPWWKVVIKKIVFKFLFQRIKTFLFIGKENKEFYQFYGVPEDKLFFTPYAVDNKRFIQSFEQLRTRKQELKKRLGIGPEKVVILYVGKLINKKRPFDLLLAYERLENKNKALIYVGDGPMRDELESYIKENKLEGVYIAGFKNQSEVVNYYTVGDVLVLPSGLGETWGLVVNEAMCFKLPIIVSDLVGCARDLVRNGENGYVFPGGDVDRLKECLEELVQNDEKRRNFGEKSFEIIQSYGYEKDVEGILQAIENNLKNKT
jgi:glycosyltransferase involved in cell wall biosynthesis